MKKKIVVTFCVILIILSLLPIPMQLKDGGSVKYKGLFYTVTDVHSLTTAEEMERGKEYNEGIIVELFGIEIFNNVR